MLGWVNHRKTCSVSRMYQFKFRNLNISYIFNNFVRCTRDVYFILQNSVNLKTLNLVPIYALLVPQFLKIKKKISCLDALYFLLNLYFFYKYNCLDVVKFTGTNRWILWNILNLRIRDIFSLSILESFASGKRLFYWNGWEINRQTERSGKEH